MDRKAACAMARELFRELEQISPLVAVPSAVSRGIPNYESSTEFFDRAAVLADVLLYTDRPEIGEELALIVAGRATPLSRRFGHLPVGTPIPEGTRATELANAVLDARNRVFPPRRGPCMPNKKELRALVERAHGAGPEAERQLRVLNKSLRAACDARYWRDTEAAMETATVAMGGYGVERATYEQSDDRLVDFYYVNMGDTYNATLVADNLAHRFRISTWGDEVEIAERRYGEPDTGGRMWRL